MTKRPVPLSVTTYAWRLMGRKKNIKKLKAFHRKCTLPSFDPWTCRARMELDDIDITPDVLNLLVKFLNQPFAKAPTGSSTGSDNTEFRWIDMATCRGHFAVRDTISCLQEQTLCTVKEMHDLFSAMADRLLRLAILDSGKFVSLFLSTPGIDHFEVEKLTIDQRNSLSPVEFARLGSMIGRSVQLRELEICLPFGDGAHQLFDGFDNAINIQTLRLRRNNILHQRQAIGGIGPLIRLLQRPQNQLKKLILHDLGLQDQHLIAISQLLPTSKLVEFYFFENLIEGGILEFAHQLPRIRTLEKVLLPTVKSNIAKRKTGDALLKGIKENTSIHTMEGLHNIQQNPLFWYYLVLNRAGRRILTSSQPVPDGLWPRVLKRAGERFRYNSLCFWIYTYVKTPWYDAVYFFLRNCPGMLSSFR